MSYILAPVLGLIVTFLATFLLLIGGIIPYGFGSSDIVSSLVIFGFIMFWIISSVVINLKILQPLKRLIRGRNEEEPS